MSLSIYINEYLEVTKVNPTLEDTTIPIHNLSTGVMGLMAFQIWLDEQQIKCCPNQERAPISRRALTNRASITVSQ